MHVLITAGPTREHVDDVRFLTNASSGTMGYCLAESALRKSWRVTLVTGPVALKPPTGADVRRITSALEMYDVCLERFSHVDGVIAAAAVADYRPATRRVGKLARSEERLQLELVPNPDILAELGRRKTHQWTVGFALESRGAIERARTKLRTKNCDAIVLNSVTALEAADTVIQLLDSSGAVALHFEGAKGLAADRITGWIADHLVRSPSDRQKR